MTAPLTSYDRIDSPIGELTLIAEGEQLIEVRFPGGEARLPDGAARGGPAVSEATRQLREYFARERRAFDLPLDPRGTGFQRSVWQALREIPFGHTISYGELARRVGNANASRAVGAANGRNPLPIVIPCHRVIGADGSLTGFGGGMERKRFLLELELEGAPRELDLFG